MFETIISADALKRLLDSGADVAVFDTRHKLDNPDFGAQAYREAHIPGALFAHLDKDLSGPIGARADGHSGRHPLPDPAHWSRRLGEWGVGPETQVVAYDDAGGVTASRLWWMLRAIGHRAVAVLDGGSQAWLQAGYPLETGTASRAPRAPYPAKAAFGELSLADVRDDVARPAEEREMLLVDARAPERYNGSVEPYGPVAGHIPGALNYYYAPNLNPDGTFRSPAELRARFEPLLARAGSKQVAMYCGSGVSACHNLLAMKIAGLPAARLFPNSWSGWIATPDLPIATGDAP